MPSRGVDEDTRDERRGGTVGIPVLEVELKL